MDDVGGLDQGFEDENNSTRIVKYTEKEGWFSCLVTRCRVVSRIVETRTIKNMTSVRFPSHKIISIRISLPALSAGGGAPCVLFLRILLAAEADL